MSTWSDLEKHADETLAERLAGWQERYPDVTVRRVVVLDRPARQLSGAVGVCPIDGCRQPRSWRIRRDVARFGQYGGRRVGPHAGDRGPSVLSAYSSGWRWDWSSLEMNTAAWVRRSMPSLANNRDT